MNTYFHGIIQYALKKRTVTATISTLFLWSFVVMANSYDRVDLQKLQKNS